MMPVSSALSLSRSESSHRGDILAGQLQNALNSRVLIEQAKGVLAERLQVDVGQALAMLRDGARSRNRRLSEPAQAVVDGTEQLAPGPLANRSGRGPVP